MRNVHLLLLPLKFNRRHLCNARVHGLVRTPTNERAGLVELAEVCVSHGMRAGAHSLTAASATSASGAVGIIGRRGAESRPPGIVLLSIEL